MVVRIRKHWVLEVRVLLLGHSQQILPFLFILLLLFFDLFWVLQGDVELVLVLLFQGLLKHDRVDFLKYRFQSIEGLLQDFMPVSFS